MPNTSAVQYGTKDYERKIEMGTKFYEVKYLNSDGVRNDKTYTYRSELDLRLGQKVICPTYKNPRETAVVVAVNCPEPGFRCKEIVEVMTEDEADA